MKRFVLCLSLATLFACSGGGSGASDRCYQSLSPAPTFDPEQPVNAELREGDSINTGSLDLVEIACPRPTDDPAPDAGSENRCDVPAFTHCYSVDQGCFCETCRPECLGGYRMVCSAGFARNTLCDGTPRPDAGDDDREHKRKKGDDDDRDDRKDDDRREGEHHEKD